MPVTLDTARLDRLVTNLQPAMERAVEKTTDSVMAAASDFVAVNTGYLQSEIQSNVNGLEGIVFDNAPYAFAQEMGRPDLPNYTFTPYMRPAAAANEQQHVQNCMDAIQEAML